MGKASIFDNFREWIGGVAFAIFLWSARMTEDEYFDELSRSAELRNGADDVGQDCPDCGGSGYMVDEEGNEHQCLLCL